MSRYISDSIRKKVEMRSDFRCEYCKINAQNTFFEFHIDHIISLKHGGKTILENLAYACQICNLNKGSDIATVLDDIQKPIRFFNPRIDLWREHFSIENTGLIIPKTSIAEATGIYSEIRFYFEERVAFA